MSVSLVTAIAELSSVSAMPKGSPGIVTLRVLSSELGSSPVWWLPSHRPSRSALQLSVKGANPAPGCGLAAGSSYAMSAQVTVALPATGAKRRVGGGAPASVPPSAPASAVGICGGKALAIVKVVAKAPIVTESSM